mgnify:CR=1 FL=1
MQQSEPHSIQLLLSPWLYDPSLGKGHRSKTSAGILGEPHRTHRNDDIPIERGGCIHQSWKRIDRTRRPDRGIQIRPTRIVIGILYGVIDVAADVNADADRNRCNIPVDQQPVAGASPNLSNVKWAHKVTTSLRH